jgi:hypothetical protein
MIQTRKATEVRTITKQVIRAPNLNGSKTIETESTAKRSTRLLVKTAH